jgi:hypothetical protein
MKKIEKKATVHLAFARHSLAAICRRRPLAAIFQLTFANKYLPANIY